MWSGHWWAVHAGGWGRWHCTEAWGLVAASVDHIVEPSKIDELMQIITIQSLLAQFAHPQVRAELLIGHFWLNVNPNILPAIDNLWWTHLPHWLGHGFGAGSPRSEMAAHHLYKLIHKSKEQIMPNMQEGKTCPSYSEWYATLEILASDRYWSQMPAEDRCTHILVATDNKKMKKSLSQEDESCSISTTKTVENKSTRPKRNLLKSMKKSNVKKSIYDKRKK